jgi:hypothetical protein
MKHPWKRFLLIATYTTGLLGVGSFGYSSYAEATSPLHTVIGRIAGQYRGSYVSAGNQPVVMKGRLEIVRTGNRYQLVGGFSDAGRKNQFNFNHAMSNDSGKLMFEDQPASFLGGEEFSRSRNNRVEIRTSVGADLMIFKIQREPQNLKIQVSSGPSWGTQTPTGTMELVQLITRKS